MTSSGPPTSEQVVSLSGNTFSGTGGLYYEDFYYSPSCAAQGAQYLDEHNGHEHDALGYHDHVTSTFPFTMGPTLYGEIPSQNNVNCSGVTVGGGGGG